jgi:hypothetical protein
MEGEGTRSSPTPFALSGDGALSQGSLCVVAPPPFGSPATSLQGKRGPWALRPRLAAGLPLSRRRSARAHVNYHTNLDTGDIYAEWPFIWGQASRPYTR